jgi:hypothetical protein
MENNDDHKEKRLRFVPSGLANEVLLDVYVRVIRSRCRCTDPVQRLFDAYAPKSRAWTRTATAMLDAVEADLEETSDGGQSNDRLFLPAPVFGRFAVTREINDGCLAPRFAPSQRAWVLTGTIVPVSPAVDASVFIDADSALSRVRPRSSMGRRSTRPGGDARTHRLPAAVCAGAARAHKSRHAGAAFVSARHDHHACDGDSRPARPVVGRARPIRHDAPFRRRASRRRCGRFARAWARG